MEGTSGGKVRVASMLAVRTWLPTYLTFHFPSSHDSASFLVRQQAFFDSFNHSEVASVPEENTLIISEGE